MIWFACVLSNSCLSDIRSVLDRQWVQYNQRQPGSGFWVQCQPNRCNHHEDIQNILHWWDRGKRIIFCWKCKMFRSNFDNNEYNLLTSCCFKGGCAPLGGYSSMIWIGTCRWDLKSRPMFIPNFTEKMRPIFIPEPQVLSKIYQKFHIIFQIC